MKDPNNILDTTSSTEDTQQLVLSTILPIVYFQSHSKKCFDIFMKQAPYAIPLKALNKSIKKSLEIIPIQTLPSSMFYTTQILKSIQEPAPQNAYQLFMSILKIVLISYDQLVQLEMFLEECVQFREALRELRKPLIEFTKQHVTQLINFNFDKDSILSRFFINDLSKEIPEYCIPELHLHFASFYSYDLFLQRADLKLQDLNESILEMSLSHHDLTSRYPAIAKEPSMYKFKDDLINLDNKGSAADILLKFMQKNKNKFQDAAQERLYSLLNLIEEKSNEMLTLRHEQLDIYYEDSDNESDEEPETKPLFNKTSLFYYGTQNDEQPPLQGLDVAARSCQN